MIESTTASGAPTNLINSEQKVLLFFGPESASQISQTFTVDQFAFDISAFNLGSDDVITINQVAGQGSGVESNAFAPVFGAVALSQSRTKVRITYPGRYQLVHTGSSNLGNFTVLGGAVVTEQDNLADAFAALIANIVGVQVQGVNPISVTGSGTVLDPYVVRLTLSPDSGNLLQVHPNGLYYGILPPPNFQNQYVSSSTGNDSNAGTIGAPLKTIAKAISNLPDGTAGNIYLYAGDTFPSYLSAIGETINTLTFLQSLNAALQVGNRMLTFRPYNDVAIDAIIAYNLANNTNYDPYVAAEINFPTISVTISLPTDNATVVPIKFFMGLTGSVAFYGCNIVMGQVAAVSPVYDSGGFVKGSVYIEGGNTTVSNVPMFGGGTGNQSIQLFHTQVQDHGTPSTPPLFYNVFATQSTAITIPPVAPGTPIILGYTDIGDNSETYLTPAALWPNITIYSTAFKSYRHLTSSIAIA